ncbi:hypothetical protein TMatcc_001277 [Talaromyces marneffei ATCC 18224]|uniref:Uncharacterized protein n=2 Tax=Talaromyces marneffei TaxID=37727 RepID=B6QJB4_TALMQ|nr:uncharacterized protein EYB26_007484 [Talaromyces marneffei]EEA22429.1 hypothetical protein PMAA_090580 [Talaromyces marneffei ATCC 18224]KAE8551334.1 hypothetical protein EYB25_005219 [Talaromyces marneffei]QGA19790.1 hypothetical protein EYB26_007484 [Talaromyces marneffei]
MVQSKLTLLALASTALAGVVRREDPEVDDLIPEDLSYLLPLDWVTPTLDYFEETDPLPTPFVQAFSDYLQEPHSTYLSTGLPLYLPPPTEDALPPFITSFPGDGEFAHTKDSPKPTTFIPTIPHPAPLGASYAGPPPTFSEPSRPEESQLATPPPAFKASSSHPPIPSSQAQTPYASPSKRPSTGGQPAPSIPASPKPMGPWDGLDPVKPSGYLETPSWSSHIPPPSKSTPGPEGSEKNHGITPSALSEAYLRPSLPFNSIPDELSEPHGNSPGSSHQAPPPYESEQETHSPPPNFASGSSARPDSSPPATSDQLPPLHGSYQGPPPFNSGLDGPSGESSPPAESHKTNPQPESYQGPSPTVTVPEEPSQPKGSPPAETHQIPPPLTKPYQESFPPPFVSAAGEQPKPESSSTQSYQLPPLSSLHSSYPGDVDIPPEPTNSHEEPSPHYGAAPLASYTCSSLDEAPADAHSPHPGETSPPAIIPPFENDKEPHDHELAPSHPVSASEKPRVTHTNVYVPHFSKPEPAGTEAPSVSHAAIPTTVPSNCADVNSKPAIPSPTSGKPQLQGTTGEHHLSGSPSHMHLAEASGVVEQPPATEAAPEPSKMGVPNADESAFHYSSFAPTSAVPITALLETFGALAFFFL